MDIDAMKVKKLRKRRALSQVDLAEVSGIGRATISRIERGLSDAQGKTVRTLAATLGVPVEELLIEEEEES